ncbi:MAG: substrate-binding domain-containing protein [Lachnospiraceae bacterium]|nr:substrate-binding domain-containing protein [Lachnospiraceae bacterium]
MRDRTTIIRTVLFVASMLAILAGLLLAMRRGDGEERRYRISVIVDRSADARWLSFRAGLEQAAEECNLAINIVPTDHLGSLTEASKLASEEIAQGADGLIMELCVSTGAGAMVNDLSGQTVLALVETQADTEAGAGGSFAYFKPDNEGIGRALAALLTDAYGDALSGMRIGVMSGRQTQTAMRERLKGFTEAVAQTGAQIVWTSDYVPSMAKRLEIRQQEDDADVIVALDNVDLEVAVDHVLALRDSGETEDIPALYGVGNSEKNVYHLDGGVIGGMVVPDEYDMGYRAAVAVSGRLDLKTAPMEDATVGFLSVTRDTMFQPDNERLLFPVAQ